MSVIVEADLGPHEKIPNQEEKLKQSQFQRAPEMPGQIAEPLPGPTSSIKQFYWQLYKMPSPPVTMVPGVQPMPLRVA